MHDSYSDTDINPDIKPCADTVKLNEHEDLSGPRKLLSVVPCIQLSGSRGSGRVCAASPRGRGREGTSGQNSGPGMGFNGIWHRLRDETGISGRELGFLP